MITKTQRILPFVLTLAVLAADQLTKLLVVARIPLGTIGWSLGGDFFRLIHVRNKAIAFSLGHGLPDTFRVVLFMVLPLLVLGFLVFYLIKNDDFTLYQRWLLSGILGGGLGNLVDRFFRPQGVVDFLDVKFYGLLGFERWPTFNVADSAIVVCGVLLIISFFAAEMKVLSKRRSASDE